MGQMIKTWGVCTSYERAKDLWSITLKDEDGKEFTYVISDMQVNCDVELGRHYFAIGEQCKASILGTCMEEWGRYCDHCGKHHEEGYYSENTGMYFCSEECLRAEYTQEEIDAEMVDEDGNGDLYWTEWYN